MTNIMNTRNKDFEKFIELLEGKEGCDFKGDGTWKCKGGRKPDLALSILKKYFPHINIEKTIKYFQKKGGYCDCEILFNVV